MREWGEDAVVAARKFLRMSRRRTEERARCAFFAALEKERRRAEDVEVSQVVKVRWM